MPARDTLYLLCHDAENDPNYSSWIHNVGLRYGVIDRPSSDWEIPENAAIIVTHNQYRFEEVSVLRRASLQNIPTLVLADGILEYRNTWDNPLIPEGAVFQPVIGHKLACIGQSQLRLIDAWNGPGTGELVGMPRLDGCLKPHHKSRVVPGEFHVLIATARTPGFTSQQVETTRQSLTDLRDWLAKHPTINGERLVTSWRISSDLADELNIETTPHNSVQNELIQALDRVDAVITTPSTVALEGMLAGRPVAWLDYHQAPALIGVVWTIQCQSHIASVMHQLLAPPPQKLDLQRTFLLDSLECQTPASDRLIKLVQVMARCGNEAYLSQGKLVLPHRVLADRTPDGDSKIIHSEDAPRARTSSQSSSTTAKITQIALDHADRKVSELENQLAEVRAELRAQEQELRRLNSKVDRVHLQLENARQNHESTKAELRQSREELTQTAQDLSSCKRQSNQRKQANSQLTHRLSAETKAVERLRDELKSTRRELSQQRRESERVAEKLELTRERLINQQNRATNLAQQMNELRSHWLVGNTIRLARLRLDANVYEPRSEDEAGQQER